MTKLNINQKLLCNSPLSFKTGKEFLIPTVSQPINNIELTKITKIYHATEYIL